MRFGFHRKWIEFNARRKVPFAAQKVEWIQRAENLEIDEEELVVVSLLRNSAYQIESFLEHYTRLGAKHIVLLDNDSTDNTIETAARFPGRITILRTTLNYRENQLTLKMWLADQFSGKGWCLISDNDERFRYPGDDRISLNLFLRYLNENKFNGVAAHMIDMFSERSISEWPGTGSAMMGECVWYDTSAVRKEPYELFAQWLMDNRFASREIQTYHGGIWLTGFGSNRQITKQILLRRAAGAQVGTVTLLAHARIADVSGLIQHYPFDRYFAGKSRNAVESKNYWNNSKDYEPIIKKLETDGNSLTLKLNTSQRLRNINQLIDENFLIVSDNYRCFVESHSA